MGRIFWDQKNDGITKKLFIPGVLDLTHLRTVKPCKAIEHIANIELNIYLNIELNIVRCSMIFWYSSQIESHAFRAKLPGAGQSSGHITRSKIWEVGMDI